MLRKTPDFWQCPCGHKIMDDEYNAFDDDNGCPKCKRSLRFMVGCNNSSKVEVIQK